MSHLRQLKRSFLAEEKIDAIHPCLIGLKIQLTPFERIFF
jgi:hypothetical protein